MLFSEFVSEEKLVSFDFDNTLVYDETEPRKEYFNKMSEEKRLGNKVIVVTSRVESDSDRKQIYSFVKDYGLDIEHDIHFTNLKLKADTLVELGVHRHYDDSGEEIKAAKQKGIEVISSFDDELLKLYADDGFDPDVIRNDYEDQLY